MKWLAFDIGCIECGEPSAVIGVYATKEEAEKACKDHVDPSTSWGRPGWHGQHYCEVFELPGVDDA